MSHSLLFLIACLALVWSASPSPGADIRVMSFNIRFGSANDGENAWPHRAELVAETIRRFDPDLLGTQETLPFQAEALGDALREWTYVGWSRDENPDGEQCGIFFRSDRFRKLDAGQFWLSETPETKYSRSWDSSLPRVVTWVRLADRDNGEAPLLFVNTHFDHRGRTARAESAKLMRRWIEDQAEDVPVIVTGDFNTAEKTEPWTTLTSSSRLIDTWRAVQPTATESEGTFHGFRGQPGSARIDWVLCSPAFRVTAAGIDRSHDGDRYPSDHFPVTAVLQTGDR